MDRGFPWVRRALRAVHHRPRRRSSALRPARHPRFRRGLRLRAQGRTRRDGVGVDTESNRRFCARCGDLHPAAAQLEPSRQFVQYEGYEDVAPALTHARLELEIQCAIGEKLPGEQLILEDGLSTASQPEDVALQLREYRLARANSEQAAALRDYYEARLQRI